MSKRQESQGFPNRKVFLFIRTSHFLDGIVTNMFWNLRRSLGHGVEVDGQEIELAITEFRLVHYLAAHAGRGQSRDILLDQVWGYSYEGYSRTVDTLVRRLRKKLGALRDRIETVRGVGYRYRAAEE